MPDFAPAAEDSATVNSYGDVHLRNHAGVGFDVPMTGDFILSEIEGRLNVEIQARHGQWKGQPGTSVLTAVTADFMGARLEIYLGDGTARPEIYIDGRRAERGDLRKTFDSGMQPLPEDFYGFLSSERFTVWGEKRAALPRSPLRLAKVPFIAR